MTSSKEFQEDIRDMVEAALNSHIPPHEIIGLLQMTIMALGRTVQDVGLEHSDEISKVE